MAEATRLERVQCRFESDVGYQQWCLGAGRIGDCDSPKTGSIPVTHPKQSRRGRNRYATGCNPVNAGASPVVVSKHSGCKSVARQPVLETGGRWFESTHLDQHRMRSSSGMSTDLISRRQEVRILRHAPDKADVIKVISVVANEAQVGSIPIVCSKFALCATTHGRQT